MAGLYAPLPTLRSHPRGGLRTDRGRRGLLLLHRSGLAPHTPCRSPGALTRVAACTLALSPIRDTLIEGFNHFVTSMTAPIASGWSGCRVGLAPTGKRLCTAHARSRPFRGLTATQGSRSRLCQVSEQRPGLLEHWRIKTFGEPVVDRREEITGFGTPALIAPEAGQTRARAQLPQLVILPICG